MSSPEYRVITDLMSVRGAIRQRSFGGVDTRRFELERVDDESVVLSVDLTDALGLVALIVEQVGAAVSPGHEVNVASLRQLAGALNRMQAKHPHGNYVGYGDAILRAIGEESGYLGVGS